LPRSAIRFTQMPSAQVLFRSGLLIPPAGNAIICSGKPAIRKPNCTFSYYLSTTLCEFPRLSLFRVPKL